MTGRGGRSGRCGSPTWGIGYETEDRDYAFSGEVTERRLTHVLEKETHYLRIFRGSPTVVLTSMAS